MSNMARPDEIDALVSSVRNLVSHKDAAKQTRGPVDGRLVLTPDLRVQTDATGQSVSDEAGNLPVLPSASRDAMAGLEATIAELEAAVTAQSDAWEPDEGESFDPTAWAASAFQIPDQDAAAVVEFAPEPTVESTPQAAQDAVENDAPEKGSDTDMAAAVASAIDEATLRALVVDIVHDELGGELGERITRNVRKLVRREINRVLTSRDMGQM